MTKIEESLEVENGLYSLEAFEAHIVLREHSSIRVKKLEAERIVERERLRSHKRPKKT